MSSIAPPVSPAHVPPATKFIPPPRAVTQVARYALCERVCAAGSPRVVLVRAPAGFGKTTVMTQCLARLRDAGHATAWLALDKADNDPSRFLASLESALALLGRPGGGPQEAEPGLARLDRLASEDAALALFLDDVEVLQEAAVLGLLREVIERLPRRGRLVLGSRSLPDLGLGRLRARGWLLELDTDDLRFRFEDTAEYLQVQRRLPLAVPDLLRLHERTEGWAAALWLASLALERRESHGEFIERFSGSEQSMADYLAEDVLARQPPALRDFLLRTSILRQLSPSLCDALMPEGGSAAHLAALDEGTLFVTSVAAAQGVREYRYHPLFADFLKAQLLRQQPVPVDALHRAASGWYEGHGRPVPAIDHAIEAGDIDRALNLLSQHAEDFLAQGRLRLLTRWFGAVPEAALARQPVLQVVRAWALCFTHGPWDALTLIERLGAADDPEAAIKLMALRPALLAMMDRYEEAWTAGQEGLRRLPPERSFAYAVMSNATAYVSFVSGRHADARRRLDAAREAQGRHASRFNLMYSESVEGLIDLQEGRMREAAARFRLAVQASPGRPDAGGAGGNAWAGVLHALAVYEVGDLVQAERLLHVYVPLARDVGLPDHMVIGHALLARIAFGRGNVDRAFEWLIELEYLGHRRRLPRVAASARLERARLLLLQGHPEAAAEELDRADDDAVWRPLVDVRLPTDVENLAVGRLRWQAHVGDAARALPALAAEMERARAAGSHRRALKLGLIETVARQRAGDRRGALIALQERLQQACREGHFRLVVDEGQALGGLVHELAAAALRAPASPDPLFTDYLQRVCRDGRFQAAPDAAAGATHLPLEPLTPTELRVLQLLGEGCSNSDLSERLFVSDSTVRTHLRNINGKLDTASRAQATAVARRLGLIV